MNDGFKQLVDAVAELQAQALGNSTMIEAIVMAHPDPAKLRECWHLISAPRIADAATSQQARGRTVDEATVYHLQKWEEKLASHHPDAGPRGT